MLRSFFFSIVLGAAWVGNVRAQEDKDKGFVFPSDLGGKRVEALLRPGGTVGEARKVSPLPRRAPAYLESPEMLLRGPQVLPPRLGVSGPVVKQPPHPAEPAPLASFHKSPSLPGAIVLPGGDLVRWPSEPVDRVPALPVLAKPAADLTVGGDPTMEASLARVLRAVNLFRLGQVPFSPVQLPDPFEHRQTVELRDPPPENPEPLLTTFPRLPGK